ncbi:MAG: polysaccharide deacetylase family protein [Bacteroidia bacterium]|nr:polysaccharide deacetylase family protein [Bacteroidia bacterium]
MIDLIIDQPSPRIDYACDLVLGRILGVRWRTLSQPEPGGGLAIWYTPANPKDRYHLPCNGWLYEKGLRPFIPPIELGPVPLLFPLRHSHAAIPFDLLAATFYLATEYARWLEHPRDPHGRPDPAGYFPWQNKLHQLPLVHHYADQLKSWLLSLQPALQFHPPKFSFEIAIDVDQPWRYLHRDALVKTGSWLRDLLRGNQEENAARRLALRTGDDPYAPEKFLDLLPVEKTLFFFLVGRQSPHDNRFPLPHPAYEKLICQVADRGFRTGLHPSYLSSDRPEIIPAEKTALEKVTGQTVYARQHFLKYQYPSTFEALLDAGIREEYSLSTFHEPGFVAGMAVPFPWFNLKENQVTQLILHPCMIMDRTLQQYMQLQPEEAAKLILKMAQQVKRANGKFVLNLHNETFSEVAEWKGWKSMLIPLIARLKEMETDEGNLQAKSGD